VHETYATAKIQSAMRSSVLPTGFSFLVESDHAELHQAEGLFRRASAGRPSFGEAHLRLGRVLALLGQPAAAESELRLALVSAQDELLQYYGDLFLGAVEEALGHFDAARASFERAAALYPTAQSPRLALSELARRQGDRGAALRAIQQVFELPPAPSRDDPWWSYHVAQARDTDDLLEALRQPFLSPEAVRP